MSRTLRSLGTMLLAPALLLGCGAEEGDDVALNDGPVKRAFETAAIEEGVPEDLLLALSWYETRWVHVMPEVEEPGTEEGEGGHGHFTGRYGIMQLDEQETNNTLGLAAELTEQPVDLLKTDVATNVRGAAAVLRRYADEMYEGVDVSSLDLFAWRDVVARWSGYEDPNDAFGVAEEVFVILRDGAGRTLESGENLELFPNPGLGEAEEEDGIGQHTGELTGMAGVRFQAASSSNYSRGRSGNRPKYITIHTMQGSYAGSISWFRNPRAKVSAHYCVRSRDGEITQMVDENDTAWHVRNWNSQAVGIEHEGFVADAAWYTDAMYRSSARLACDIAKRWNIPVDRQHIKGHVEFSGNSHTDPGRHWNWDYYMSLVRQCAGGGGGTRPPPADDGGNPGTNPGTPSPGTGLIQGVVYADGNVNNRLGGAVVRLSNGKTVTAASNGYWSLRVAPGTYHVTASRDGYRSGSVTRQVTANSSIWASTSLSRDNTSSTGRITGLVYEAGNSSKRLAGATVRVGATTVKTDGNGRYSLNAPAGAREVDISASGFLSITLTSTVRGGQTSTVNAGLHRSASKGSGKIIGVIYESPNTNKRIAGARVTVSNGVTSYSATTGGNGVFELNSVPVGNYRVTASADGYGSGSKSVTAVAGQERWGSVGLRKLATGGGAGKLIGVVYESPNSSKRLPGATVTLSSGVTVSTDANGVYEVPASGTVTAVASLAGYQPRGVTRRVPAGRRIWGSIGLVKGGSGTGATGQKCTPTAPRTIHMPPRDIKLVSPLRNASTTLSPTFEFEGIGDATASYKVVVIKGDKMENPSIEYDAGKAGADGKVKYKLTAALTADVPYIWSAYAIWPDCQTTEPGEWGFFTPRR